MSSSAADREFEGWDVRGLHASARPQVRPRSSAVPAQDLDVAVDLRTESPTFGRHHGAQLSEENEIAVVLPPGVAHGLNGPPDSEVWYPMRSHMHLTLRLKCAGTIPIGDCMALGLAPAFTISTRDRELPLLQSGRRRDRLRW